MKLIYIAGAYSAPTIEGIAVNIAHAARAAALINDAGERRYFAQCPHTHSNGIYELMKNDSEQFWLEGDIEWMKRCDGIVFILDWQASKGAHEENRTAGGLLIPKFYMGELTMQFAQGIIENFDYVFKGRD